MINPQSVNPFALPSVPLENRKQLPEKPCIYFAIDSRGAIQYIGQSKNLRQRWSGHHRYSALDELGGVKVAWLELSDESLLYSVETALIQYFDPPLNHGIFPVQNGKFGVKGTEPLGRRISVRLHQSVEDKLSAIAGKKNVSSSELIRWIVSDALLGEGKYLELIGKEDENE